MKREEIEKLAINYCQTSDDSFFHYSDQDIWKEGFKGIDLLNQITHRNYLATVRRGLISERTVFSEFTDKLDEEVNELYESYNHEPGIGRINFNMSELADITLVCFAMAEHYGIDLVDEMRKKTEFNEKRKD